MALADGKVFAQVEIDVDQVGASHDAYAGVAERLVRNKPCGSGCWRKNLKRAGVEEAIDRLLFG